MSREFTTAHLPRPAAQRATMVASTRAAVPSVLEDSIVVVAHPDDEVLWFSSILDKVNDVVVCFLEAKRYPWWSVGRRKSLEEYPIKHISCLNIDQSDVFESADWQNPVATEYGIEIVDQSIPGRDEQYKKNYEELRRQLEKRLSGYRNVYTHNPWGEYGHEEHVQVYRAVKSLQGELGFNLWYSNYVSNKSFKLMSSHLDRFHFEYVAFKTNKSLAHEIKHIYIKNKCWTWYGDWEWFKKELFIREVSHGKENNRGHAFPTNFIKMNPSSSYNPPIKRTMVEWMKETLGKFGVSITRPRFRKVVSLQPENSSKGDVLLSWLVDPFLLKPGEPMPNSHTQYWDCFQIARTFLDLGYSVDVIDSRNKTFDPTKNYSVFIGHRINFDRIAELLKRDCVKIAHLDTAQWVFNNHATYLRKIELQQRRGVTIRQGHRIIEHNLAIENADYGVTYGNRFTLDTYRYANKPIFRVPISTCALFPWPEDKNYDACRYHFLWFGSEGLVHKGLDLVLEAFAEMPDCHLYVCGPLQQEQDFVKAYYKELYQTPNIHAFRWVDVNGPEFAEIANKCLGLVYPSCSEAGGGSVITCMHAGMIPIVSYEASVDVDDFGVVLKDHSVETIKNTVRMIAGLPAEQLQRMARKAWEFARAHHTRENFSEEYKNIVLDIMNKKKSGEGSVQ
ncbi:MAG: glycosyltransferase [Nitrospira sp.]